MSFDFGGAGSSGPSSGGYDPVPPLSGGGANDYGTQEPSSPEGPSGADVYSFGSGLPETSRPPLHWLGLGALLAVAAIVVHLVAAGFWAGLAGWVLGGPVVIGLLALFVLADAKQAAHAWYAPSPAAAWGRRALVLLSLVAVGLNAWAMADVIARGGL